VTRAADKVSIEFTLKRGPVSSEVERKRKAMHVPSNEIHSRSSPLYTSFQRSFVILGKAVRSHSPARYRDTPNSDGSGCHGVT